MTDDLPDHTNYSLIKAVDESGNIVTVLVDASGRMYAVMKGDYGGALKTLALDDQGRIQAVLTDPEDVFGNPNYIGAGELAARLGSIKSFEHRGQVVWMDDFKASTMKWTTFGTGTGNSVARSNAYALSGDYSLKLLTGNAEDDTAAAYRMGYYPPSKRIGFECAVSICVHLKIVEFSVYIYDGSIQYRCSVYYYPQDGDLKIYIPPSTFQTIDADLDLLELQPMFHYLKVVFDVSTKKYVRLFVDANEYDISAYDMYHAAYVQAPRLMARVRITNNAAGSHCGYIDNAIVTQNEP